MLIADSAEIQEAMDIARYGAKMNIPTARYAKYSLDHLSSNYVKNHIEFIDKVFSDKV